MASPAAPRRRRGLLRQLSIWIGLSTAASLVVFAAVAYLSVFEQESAEGDQPDADVVARQTAEEIGDAMLLAAPIALGLAVIGAVIAARRLLRPLHEVIEAAARMTPSDLRERLPVPPRDDEMQAVVLALNAMLARLESGFAALGRFAAEASHELRTPLAVMATELEVMLQHPRSPADWDRSARTCLDEVQHVSRLVEALLALSRAEGGAVPATEWVSLPELVVGVVADQTARAAAAGVRLTVEPPARDARPPEPVRGQAVSLASALANLVENALRYTPPGGEVRVSCPTGPGGEATLRVDDSGPGVAADEVDRIFEPFFRGREGRAATRRADAPVFGAATGSGLGLTIARRVFELHRGRLSVARSPLGGARFEVRF